MKKIIITYGLIAGVVIIGSMTLSLALAGSEDSMGFLEVLGYLIMIVALSAIFVGIKRYRDQKLGGVIRFGTATAVGLGITLVASVIYVAAWEVNLALTDYAFIHDYTDALIATKKAEGVTATDLDAFLAEMETLKTQYANPLFRLPQTFLEIFPVGLLITLISAAILRNNKVLPAAT